MYFFQIIRVSIGICLSVYLFASVFVAVCVNVHVGLCVVVCVNVWVRPCACVADINKLQKLLCTRKFWSRKPVIRDLD